MKTTLGIAALTASAMMLSGCAIPIGVQIAKLSLDGISYITTQKSLTDHGISLVTGEDCAMHRIITKGALCSDWNDDESVTVDLEVAPAGEEAAVPEPDDAVSEDPAAEFETAAGRPVDIVPAPTAAAPVASAQPAPASVESRLDQTEPVSIEVRVRRDRGSASAVPERAAPESDGVVMLWDRDAEVGAAKSADNAAPEDVAVNVAPIARPSAPVTEVVGLPEGPALLSLWETGVENRGNVISMREWRKILDTAAIPGERDKPARPEPTKAANVGAAQVTRVSGLSRPRANAGGA